MGSHHIYFLCFDRVVFFVFHFIYVILNIYFSCMPWFIRIVICLCNTTNRQIKVKCWSLVVLLILFKCAIWSWLSTSLHPPYSMGFVVINQAFYLVLYSSLLVLFFISLCSIYDFWLSLFDLLTFRIESMPFPK